MAGVKETKELLVGVNELALILVARLKDGFQASEDIAAIIAKLQADEDFKAKMKAAYDGVAAIPDEVKDLDLAEGIELALAQAAYVPKILEAAKKA